MKQAQSEEITLAEAAGLIGVSKSRVEQYVKDGRLKVVRLVGTLRVVSRKAAEAVRDTERVGGRPSKEKRT